MIFVGCDVTDQLARKLGIEPWPCCTSCHDDSDLGYSMCARYIDRDNDHEIEVCCSTTQAIDAHPELWEALVAHVTERRREQAA